MVVRNIERMEKETCYSYSCRGGADCYSPSCLAGEKVRKSFSVNKVNKVNKVNRVKSKGGKDNLTNITKREKMSVSKTSSRTRTRRREKKGGSSSLAEFYCYSSTCRLPGQCYSPLCKSASNAKLTKKGSQIDTNEDNAEERVSEAGLKRKLKARSARREKQGALNFHMNNHAQRFVAVSPKIFQKERNLRDLLQACIKVPFVRQRKSICFDPVFGKSRPRTPMFIANLYSTDRSFQVGDIELHHLERKNSKRKDRVQNLGVEKSRKDDLQKGSAKRPAGEKQSYKSCYSPSCSDGDLTCYSSSCLNHVSQADQSDVSQAENNNGQTQGQGVCYSPTCTVGPEEDLGFNSSAFPHRHLISACYSSTCRNKVTFIDSQFKEETFADSQFKEETFKDSQLEKELRSELVLNDEQEGGQLKADHKQNDNNNQADPSNQTSEMEHSAKKDFSLNFSEEDCNNEKEQTIMKGDSSREPIVEESSTISVNNETLKDVAKIEEGNEAQRIKDETAKLENATKGTLSEEKGVKS